jgi:uncharacterized membrane protein
MGRATSLVRVPAWWPPMRHARPRLDGPVLGAAVVGFAVGFALLSIRVNDAFNTGRFDLGNMVQAVFSSAHGRLLQVTDVHGHQISRLASHFDPILAALAPLWRLWPSADLLLTAQAVAVALGALPVYWLGREHLRSPHAGLVFALLYLLYPATGWLTLNEFHPVALACPLLLFAIWYLDQDRLLPFALFALLALTTKEQIGLDIAALGVWYALARKHRRSGLAICVAGLLVSFVAIYVVVPHFNGAASSFYSRYASVGESPAGVVATVFTHPLRVLQLLTTRHLNYLADLLLPLGALPLLSPLALVAVPELALNLLSSVSPQSSVRFHYTAAEIPVLVAAAVLGAEWLTSRDPARARTLPWALIVVALAASYQIGPVLFWPVFPGAGGNLVRAVTVTRHDRIAAAGLALIPDGEAVSATNSLGAHLSARAHVFSFPVIRDARWIAVDEKKLSYQDRFATIPAALRLVALRRDNRWQLAFEDDGIDIFRRAAR